MSAGTLTLTNNSATVSGAGTTFTTDLAAGDFIVVTVGGVPYTLPIKTVNSNTSLTLVSNYTGPTQVGAAWSAVPRVALNMVTAALVAQSVEAMRGLNYDKQNWQQLFSVTGTITVKLPDGSQFSGPSWKYLADNMATKTDGAVPVTQGGTGATKVEDARTNLGLGSSATRDAYSTTGKMLSEGDFGVGGITGPQINSLAEGNATSLKTGFYCGNGDNFAAPGGIGNGQFIGVIAVGMASDQYKAQIATSYGGGGRVFYRRSMAGIYQQWSEFYTTSNTTKASDGTLKAASPVARIVTSQEACQREDVAEDGFVWCGSGTANAEAEGVNISRLDVGVYVLTGSAGLASEGWQLLPPMDPGGMGELGVVEAEQTESGGLTIRLFKRKYMLSDDGEIEKAKGEPIDVPASSWIDVRLDMPESSIWNQKQLRA